MITPDDRDRRELRHWRRRLSERAFVAANLPFAGLAAMFAFDSLVNPHGRYTALALMLAMLALPWQILAIVLRGMMWMQSIAVAGRAAPPALRAQLATIGARGWIIGGAASGLWILLVTVLGRLAGFGNGSDVALLALSGFLLLGPLIGLLLSTRQMNIAADRLGEPANDEPGRT